MSKKTTFAEQFIQKAGTEAELSLDLLQAAAELDSDVQMRAASIPGKTIFHIIFSDGSKVEKPVPGKMRVLK